jgi:hypothetical protein
MTKALFLYQEQKEKRDFPRIPLVGDHISIDTNSEDLYQVTLVIHCPFNTDYEVEVYAVKVDHLNVKKKALGETGTASWGPNPLGDERY